MTRVSWFGSLVVLLSIVSQSSADLILSTSSPSFAQDSGVQQIDVFVNSTTGTDLGTVQLSTFLAITAPAGSFTEVTTPATFVNDASGPFSFQNSAFLGNVVGAGSSSDIDPGDVRNAFVGFEFNNPQVFTTTPTLLGSFNFDVTGLVPGIYNFAFTPDAGGAVASLPSVGSFTVTAVPEPSSVLLIGGIGLVAFGYSRRKHASVADLSTAA